MQGAGLTVEEDLIAEGDYSPISGYHAMKELLKKGKKFSAVFCRHRPDGNRRHPRIAG